MPLKLWRWSKRAISQEIQVASKIYKRPGNRPYPEPYRKECCPADFSQGDLLDLRLIQLQDNKFVLFHNTNFVVNCYSCSRKLIRKQDIDNKISRSIWQISCISIVLHMENRTHKIKILL